MGAFDDRGASAQERSGNAGGEDRNSTQQDESGALHDSFQKLRTMDTKRSLKVMM
jgi:hypothetical protein